MATDRVRDDAESTAPADQQAPPPADRPGATGYPSRADSRDGAAAANKSSSRSETTAEQSDTADDAPPVPETDESSVDGAAGDDADVGESEDAMAVSGRSTGESLRVDGKPLREYLDPVGAAAWTSDVGDPVVDPEDRTGSRIADTELEDTEKNDKVDFDAFRKRFNKERESLVDKAGKTTSRLQDIMAKHPPAGHMESRPGPEMSPAPVQGLDAGDLMTTGLAAGIMAAGALRKIRDKITRTERG